MLHPARWCGCRWTGPTRRPAARLAALRPSPSRTPRPSTVDPCSCHLPPKRRLDLVMIAERQRAIADDLAAFVAFAGDQQNVAGLERRNRTVDRLAPVADLAHIRSATSPFQDGGADRSWIFAARIIVSDDDAIGAFCRDRAHQCAFALVAVAARAEHDDKLTFDVRPQRLDSLFQGVRLVG